jgi:hypothetical protein
MVAALEKSDDTLEVESARQRPERLSDAGTIDTLFFRGSVA